MKRSGLVLVVLGSVGVLIIAGAFAFSTSRKVPSQIWLPDEMVSEKLNQLPEAKAFLAKYTAAIPFIDRSLSSGVGAGYFTSKSVVTGESKISPDDLEPRIAFSALFNDSAQIDRIWLRCVYIDDIGSRTGFNVESNIVEYLQHDFHCWDDPAPPEDTKIDDIRVQGQFD